MSRNKKYQFSIKGQALYPHIKMTREAFPRLLSTRKIAADGAEYFGPFLNRTAARILIDFLDKTFRLRTCFIEIDGSFEVPCTQHYAKRCVAPCVKSLCEHGEYSEIVELSRLFLRNDRGAFESEIRVLIDNEAAKLNYERAGFLRDILKNVVGFWLDKRHQVWLADSVDTFAAERNAESIDVFLVTTRGRRMLGSRVFSFDAKADIPAGQVVRDIISQFYIVHAPREIRVSHDFPQRAEASSELSRRFGRAIRIVVVNAGSARITVSLALNRTRLGSGLESLKEKKSLGAVQQKLKSIFGLNRLPMRIEAFDVAHISGTGFAAAMSVWQKGELTAADNRHWLPDAQSELEALESSIRRRLVEMPDELPDLLIVDGGIAHLKAALRAASEIPGRRFAVVAAVKPPRKHSQISHFILESGRRIDFESDRDMFGVLQILRDEAHALCNSAHREIRDMAHFYELSGILPSLNERQRQKLINKFGSIKSIVVANEDDILSVVGAAETSNLQQDLGNYRDGKSMTVRPLIVPIRYEDPNGEASDLRPIKT